MEHMICCIEDILDFLKEQKTEAQTIVDRMKAEKKILIKAYPNVGEFGNCLRVSIGEEKYMKQFMDALLEIDQ